MNRFSPSLRLSVLLGALPATVTACQDSATSHRARSGNNHHGHGHRHDAPHGGKVIVLGEEAFHLELVHDPASGRLTLYVPDGHMENFGRLNAPTIPISLTVAGAQHPLELAAVAQPATGETVGDTSRFSTQADWLRSAGNLGGRIAAIELRGQTVTGIAFELKGGSPMK